MRAVLVPEAGPRVTGRRNASATLLWDVVADAWSAPACAAAGIDHRLVPGVR